MKELKKIIVYQQVEYAILWVVSLCICIVYEYGWLEEGVLTGNPRLCYGLETLGVLLTLALVPISLKGFNFILKKHIRSLSLLEALKAYHLWTAVRLAVLALLAWGNLWLYYATVNNIGSLCALIVLASSLFCVPGRQRAMHDLEMVE